MLRRFARKRLHLFVSAERTHAGSGGGVQGLVLCKYAIHCIGMDTGSRIILVRVNNAPKLQFSLFPNSTEGGSSRQSPVNHCGVGCHEAHLRLQDKVFYAELDSIQAFSQAHLHGTLRIPIHTHNSDFDNCSFFPPIVSILTAPSTTYYKPTFHPRSHATPPG